MKKSTVHIRPILSRLIMVVCLLLIREVPEVPANERAIACYRHNYQEGSLELNEEQDNPDENSIFFHDTTCYNKYDSIIINSRQACAVESAARLHPNRRVFLLYNSPIKYNNDSSTNSRSRRLITELLKYPNIKIRRIRIDRYAKDTPLQNWDMYARLNKSLYPVCHASDVLRYLTLWKYGGTYLDMDVIVMRSLDALGNNFAASLDGRMMAGVLNFNKNNLRYPIASHCIHEIRQNFRGNQWAYNGPGVISRVIAKMCKIPKLMTTKSCKGFSVLGPQTFYPIHYLRWEQYFNQSFVNTTLAEVRNAYAVHLWNNISCNTMVYKNNEPVAYGLIASEFCPNVYRESDSVF